MFSPKALLRTAFSYILVKTIKALKTQSIEILKTGKVPGHIAFIMDGNRTFAKKEGLSSLDGHTNGAKALVKVLRTCYDLGIEEISVYAFSIENFKRPKDEVETIMDLLSDSLEKLTQEQVENDSKVRIRVVGNRSLIKDDILKRLCQIEAETNVEENHRCLNVCFPYTSRDDIAQSIRHIATKYTTGSLLPHDITEDAVSSNLYVGQQTKPLDLLIRTSGHFRLSDFLLWECNSKCAIKFSTTLWPEFGTFELLVIILRWIYEKDESFQPVKSDKAYAFKVNHVDLKALPAAPAFASVASGGNTNNSPSISGRIPKLRKAQIFQ